MTKSAKEDRLIEIISANTAAMTGLKSVVDGYCKVQEQTQQILQLLVTQVTTSISQRNDAVPLRVFLIVVLVLAAIIALVIGVDVTGIHNWGGAT